MGPTESHIRRGWVLLSHTSDWRLAGGDSQLQKMELESTTEFRKFPFLSC